MTTPIEIRGSGPEDVDALASIYRDAFPDEDLLPLVSELVRNEGLALSLVGSIDARPVAHVIFTRCAVSGSSDKAALLAPLAVAPAWQRQGIGSAMVGAGLHRLKDETVSQVFVLGDPAYYGRFGFEPESRVSPPYPLPAQWRTAWQSKLLSSAATRPRGKLKLPQPWLRPALWAP